MERRYIQGSAPNPAAGADLADVPNYGDTFRLLSLRAVLTTDAVVANRVVNFQLVSPSGAVIHDIGAATVQTAGLVVTYDCIGANGSRPEGTATLNGLASIPLPDLWWPAGTKVRTVTTALDVADQWSGIYWSALVGDEWEHLRWLEEIAGAIGG